jgi:DNA-binding response OmpR family regulator
MTDSLASIREFLGDSACLIVEPSQAFSASIQTCLIEQGVPAAQIVTLRKYADAKKFIAERKPKLVVSEYDLGSDLGLSLMEQQGEHHEDTAKISIIVTKNNSDSAVAEAAEEQIDAFILKPFSVEAFRQKLGDVFRRKTNPSPYMQKVREGKTQLHLENFANAVSEFTAAKSLDAKPTLACYYAGQAYQGMGQRAQALAEFKEGRRYQPLHYKCLIGEFENLMEDRKYDQAYGLVSIIRNNYPITSHRLGQIFIAAVFTYHFDELPTFYQLFLNLEQRPPRLVQLTAAALLTAGRYWIQKQDFAKALACYEMGITACSRDLNYIEKIIADFIGAGAYPEAQLALQRCSPSDVGTAMHTKLSFRIDQHVLNPEQVIERGRKLINAGEAEPAVFTTVIRLLAERNRVPMAESVINAALQQNPSLREELYALLEKHRPPENP